MIKNSALKAFIGEELVEIPVIEVFGNKPGKNLVVVAGLHGDEYDAISAILNLLPQINIDELSGNIFFITIGNPLAFANQTRETPASYRGGNLARLFPGDYLGSPTQVIARTIWDFILEKCTSLDLVIDLHSGGQFYSYARMAGVRGSLPESPQTNFAKLAARAMRIENLWIMEPTPGTLTQELILQGIPAIGCEVEGRGVINPDEVQVYVEGIMNILRLTNHLIGDAILTDGDFYRTITIYSSKSGFAVVLPQTHSRVNKGEIICRIIDGVGNLVEEIASPENGEVWASRTNPSVGRDEIIALVKISNT